MHRRERLFFVLTVVCTSAVPALAWGQEPPSLPPPPPATATTEPPWQATSPPPQPPAVPAYVYPSQPYAYVGPTAPPGVRYDPSPGTRWVFEGLAGVGMSIAFALGGGLIGYGIGSSSRDPWVGMVLLGGAAATFGLPLGVLLVGHARGGNGGYGWSLLGTLAGNLLANLIILGVASDCSGDCAGSVVAASALGLLLPAAGAVVGYELSNDQNSLSAPPGARVRLAPTLQLGQGGGLVGVGATF